MEIKLLSTFQILIIFCIFNISFSKETFKLDSETKKKNYTDNKLVLEFEPGIDLKDYLIIKVRGFESGTTPHIIEFCKNENSNTRIQLAHNPSPLNYLWITKEQVEEGKIIKVTSPKDNCNYELEISTSDKVNMFKDSVYTYYVSENNKKMVFNFPISSFLENENKNNFKSITIWVIGGEKIESINIKEDLIINSVNEDGRNIYNLNIKDVENIEVKLEAKEGGLITIGSTLVHHNYDPTPISLNNTEVYGYLTTDSDNKMCYSLSETGLEFSENNLIFMSIRIFNDIGEFLVLDSSASLYGYGIIDNGNYMDLVNKTFIYCINIPNDETYNIDKIIYRIQISQNDIYSSLLYNPQILGEFYPRMLEKNNYATFIGVPPFETGDTIKYNMITTYGLNDMFFAVCNDYPLCFYNDSSITEAKDPYNINLMSSYSAKYNKSITPIGPTQNILIVKCTKGLIIPSPEKNIEFCGFHTMIYSNDIYIELMENQIFNQYILMDEIEKYKISLKSKKNLFKLYVDLMIYSGDVIFKIEYKNEEQKEEEIDNKYKYQTANKISYIIDDNELSNATLYFQVIAKKNSFYSIQYTLVRESQKNYFLTNRIPNGVNYLVTIEPFDVDVTYPKKQYLQFTNMKIDDKAPFLINFYSLNCQLRIYNDCYNDDNGLIYTKDYSFSQDIIYENDERYNNSLYCFVAEIAQMEQGTYDKRMCMLYASSIELEKTENERQILVSENIPQRAIFINNSTIIKYLYVIPNIDNNLGIRFVLIDKAKYEVIFYIIRKEIKRIIVSNDQQEILESKDYKEYCQEDQPCSLVISIRLNEIYLMDNSTLEITIKSLGKNDKYPSYLIKNRINNDYLNSNNTNYYYTDIGTLISGEIIINYYRGHGKIYGKIVNKTQPIEDLNKEWRGIYDFPKSNKESLPYINYLKKLVFTENDTKHCISGCYLLLTVENKIISSSTENISRKILFDILISTQSRKEYPLLVPVPLEKYIIGNIVSIEGEYAQNYYLFIIPYDAEKIVFDFQSEYATIFVNLYISEEFLYPYKNSYHWRFKSSGKPGLYEIKKESLLELAKKNQFRTEDINSIEGLMITIGISAEKTDSIFTTIYAFKIHLSIKDELNIHDVYSDQQTLCNLTEFKESNGKYRCLFLIRYDNSDDNLFIYPLFEDQSIDYHIYADFIDEEIYDLNNIEELEKAIPNKTSNYTTDNTREDILNIYLNDENKYVFVNIEADKPSIVKLLTTFSTNDYTTNPNPSTPQLYVFKNNEELKFKFSSKDELMLNFVGLQGSANIYWEDEKDKNIQYKIGRNDRLSLTSSHIKDRQKINNTLVIKNTNPSNEKGFIFYITYYLRSSEINFDQLLFDNSFNINYRETDLPIYIYIKLDNINQDTNVFITLNSLEGDSVNNNEEEEFQVFGWILKDTLVFDVKSTAEVSPKTEDAIKGIYDPAKRVCLLSLKKGDIEKFNVTAIDVPTLVVKIDKSLNKKRIYNRISMVGTVLQDDSLIPIKEKVYQHGKLKKGKEKMVYKLRTDKKQTITTIIFSSNSDKLDFTITKDVEGKESLNLNNKKQSNGRIIIYIKTEPDKYNYIYLTIYQKDRKPVTDESLTNYAFKYINAYDESSINIYDTSMKYEYEYSKKDNIYKLKVNKVKCEECKVIYYMKLINRTLLVEGESFENIAVVESKGTVMKYDNLTYKNDKAVLVAKDIDYDVSNIQIIAYIINESINEFIAYNSKYISPKTSSFIIFVIIAVSITVLIILVFIFFIIRTSRKNRDLMDQIQQTSFNNEDEKEEREGIDRELLMDE